MQKTIRNIRKGIVLVVLLSGACVQAKDHYFLPKSTGSGDGSSWENAQQVTPSALKEAWKALAPGEVCWLGSGTYENLSLEISSGGVFGKQKYLRGKDTGNGMSVIKGDFEKKNPASTGADMVVLEAGVHFVAIENIRFENVKTAIRLTGKNKNISIKQITVENSRDAFWFDGGGEKEAPELASSDIQVQDCSFKGFTKRAIRFRRGIYNVLVSDSHADAGGKEWATERFQMAFHVEGNLGTNAPDCHDITFRRCTAMNCYDDNGKGYWNADGFAAERGVYGLKYYNCRSFDHTDGGWDDKSTAPLLVDCIAFRNKRNFRFWGSQDEEIVLKNCISGYATKRGGNSFAGGIWLGGKARAEFCTFYNNSTEIDLDIFKDRKTGEKRVGSLILENCIVASSGLGKGVLVDSADPEKVILNETVLWKPEENEESPAFVKGDNKVWMGMSKDFDSQRYGISKGFHSSRITGATNLSRLFNK